MNQWRKKKQKALVFGTGAGGRNFYAQQNSHYEIIGFLDNNKQQQGKLLFDIPILSPESILEIRYDIIFIASDYYSEIYTQLTETLQINRNHIHLFKPSTRAQKLRSIPALKNKLRLYTYDLICAKKNLISDLVFHLIFRNHVDVKRLKLCWLDQCDKYKIHTFRPITADFVQPPRVIGRSTPRQNLTLPEVALYRFSNPQFNAVPKALQLPSGQIVIERVPTSTTPTADYCSGNILHHGQDLALVRTNTSALPIKKGILITGCSEVNYYHWIAEILTQFLFIRELPTEFHEYPILIPQHSQKIPAIKKILELFTIQKKVKLLDSMETYQVEDLLVISASVNQVPNYRGPVVGKAENSFARPESIKFLRDFAVNMTSDSKHATLPDRVFLARRGTIRKYNQEEVESIFKVYNFTSIYMEELDITQQIAIASNAKFIAGPSGAAWTNIAFASNETKALCWMPAEFGQSSCFSNIAAINNIDMDYIIYPAGTANSRDLYHHDYHLEIEPIKQWLSSNIRNG